MNKRIRRAVILALAGGGLAALPMGAAAITKTGAISNVGTTSASGSTANKNGAPLYAWDGSNSSRGTPNVLNGNSRFLGWAHNSLWYDIAITEPGNYSIRLTRADAQQTAFHPAFSLWAVGPNPFDFDNCAKSDPPVPCGDAAGGGTHSYNQVAAPSPANASAWMLSNAGATPSGKTLNWTPKPGTGPVTGFIGYANSGTGGWKNGLPVNTDGGVFGSPDPFPDYNTSQDQDVVQQGGYVNTEPGGGLGGSTLGSASNVNSPEGAGAAVMNLFAVEAGHYLLAMGGSCQYDGFPQAQPRCGALNGGADYLLEITEITGSDPVASAKASSPVRAGAEARLDGSASNDPGGNAITYAWSQLEGPPVEIKDSTAKVASFTAPPEAVGQSLKFLLTIRSPIGATATAEVPVMVTNDNNPPAVGIIARPVLEGALVTLNSTFEDPDGDQAASFLWKQTGGPEVALTKADGKELSFTAPGVGGSAELSFSLTATDDYALNPQSATATATVTISDDPTLLDCSGAYASRESLQPNKAMTPVTIMGITAPFPYNLDIGGVVSDEPVKNKAGGDKTGPDAKIKQGAKSKKKPRIGKVLLRAERQSDGDGRIYTVSFTATAFQASDGGQACKGSVKIEVPMAPGQAAIDGGQSFDATRKK
jgi:hypothetical protein